MWYAVPASRCWDSACIGPARVASGCSCRWEPLANPTATWSGASGVKTGLWKLRRPPDSSSMTGRGLFVSARLSARHWRCWRLYSACCCCGGGRAACLADRCCSRRFFWRSSLCWTRLRGLASPGAASDRGRSGAGAAGASPSWVLAGLDFLLGGCSMHSLSASRGRFRFGAPMSSLALCRQLLGKLRKACMNVMTGGRPVSSRSHNIHRPTFAS